MQPRLVFFYLLLAYVLFAIASSVQVVIDVRNDVMCAKHQDECYELVKAIAWFTALPLLGLGHAVTGSSLDPNVNVKALLTVIASCIPPCCAASIASAALEQRPDLDLLRTGAKGTATILWIPCVATVVLQMGGWIKLL